MSRVQAKALVTVTVEIEVPGTWGPDCQIAQVHRQAAETALGIVARMKRHPVEEANFRLIGEPKVTSVLTEVNV